MPTYDYQCQACGKQMVYRHSMNDTAKSLNLVCEKCGSEKLTKMIAAPFVASSSSGSSSGREFNSAPSCATGTCPFAQ